MSNTFKKQTSIIRQHALEHDYSPLSKSGIDTKGGFTRISESNGAWSHLLS